MPLGRAGSVLVVQAMIKDELAVAGVSVAVVVVAAVVVYAVGRWQDRRR